ncbi:VOC family protein [Ramlibacter sp. AW1]|uniref:VOC family protein n=1 Tax=Ramlibacter aurantiacus TaxID=2801330 RepID=A0A936ZEI0_9BURK|nr:VOC family protein [Ramlibacter aurantiacus]MBL0420084.1 VOC family protein [Ramlibacter aurantiacus]
MSDFVPIRQLHHFAWRCRDAEETRRFYEDLLGLPLTHVVRADHVPSTGDHCPFVHLFFEMRDGSSIAFFDLGDDQAADPSPNTPAWVNHLALRVDSEAELVEARRRLTEAGVEVRGPIDHDGFVKSIYFFDPNGIRLELTTLTASEDELAGYRRKARAACDAWTREKQAARAASSTTSSTASSAA